MIFLVRRSFSELGAGLCKYHQEKTRSLLGARVFSVTSPTEFGRLGPLHFTEKWRFAFEGALLCTFRHFPSPSVAFGTSKMIEAFADGHCPTAGAN